MSQLSGITSQWQQRQDSHPRIYPLRTQVGHPQCDAARIPSAETLEWTRRFQQIPSPQNSHLSQVEVLPLKPLMLQDKGPHSHTTLAQFGEGAGKETMLTLLILPPGKPTAQISELQFTETPKVLEGSGYRRPKGLGSPEDSRFCCLRVGV